MKSGRFLTRFFTAITLAYLFIAYVPVKSFVTSFVEVNQLKMANQLTERVEGLLHSDRLTPGEWKNYLNQVKSLSTEVVGESYLNVKKVLTPFNQDYLKNFTEGKYSDWKVLVANQNLVDAKEITYQKKLMKLMPRYESFKNSFKKFKKQKAVSLKKELSHNEESFERSFVIFFGWLVSFFLFLFTRKKKVKVEVAHQVEEVKSEVQVSYVSTSLQWSVVDLLQDYVFENNLRSPEVAVEIDCDNKFLMSQDAYLIWDRGLRVIFEGISSKLNSESTVEIQVTGRSGLINVDFVIRGLDFGDESVTNDWKPILAEVERRLAYLKGNVFLTRLINNGVSDSFSRLRVSGREEVNQVSERHRQLSETL